MEIYNLNDKKFVLLENSENGEVDSTTIFEYQQKDDLVTAKYHGGTIKYGKIIAHIEGDELEMLYQCSTIDNQLKAGKALAKISTTEQGKIKLSLNWEWLNGNDDKGKSEYIEV
tara:strand:- start:683 stop:1024 length:342 start_codon:yes stop_codon:yes gene_type:complete